MGSKGENLDFFSLFLPISMLWHKMRVSWPFSLPIWSLSLWKRTWVCICNNIHGAWKFVVKEKSFTIYKIRETCKIETFVFFYKVNTQVIEWLYNKILFILYFISLKILETYMRDRTVWWQREIHMTWWSTSSFRLQCIWSQRHSLCKRTPIVSLETLLWHRQL